MKTIATWCFKPFLAKKGPGWDNLNYMLIAAMRSIDLMARFYGRPTIYTDTLGADILSQLTKNADYQVEYDHVFDDLNPALWAFPKILTYSKQKTEFLHFDLDFLLLKEIPANFFEADVAYQHNENLKKIRAPCYNLEKIKNIYDLPSVFNKENLLEIKSPNMGIFYIKDMQLKDEYCSLAMDIISRNRALINSGPVIGNCVVEQQLLGILLSDRLNLKTSSLVPDGEEDWNKIFKNFVHFWGDMKINQPFSRKYHQDHLVPFLTDEIEKASNYIRSLQSS